VKDTYLIPVKAHQAPIADLGLCTDCPLCGWHAAVNEPGHHTSPGTISQFHHDRNGVCCPAAGMAVTLEAAIARDGRLNPEEQAVDRRIRRYLHSCRGPLVDGQCYHPSCERAVNKGLRWTLDGWKKADDRTALF